MDPRNKFPTPRLEFKKLNFFKYLGAWGKYLGEN
jgi:hypothetical protein